MAIAFSPVARRDVVRQYRYLLREAGTVVADRFLDAMKRITAAIEERPAAGGIVWQRGGASSRFRSRSLHGFRMLRVYYTTIGPEVIVARVLHVRRDLPALLERDVGGAGPRAH